MDEPTNLMIGQTAEFTKTFSPADVYAFAAASGDRNPVHLEVSYAEQTVFGGRIVHGLLVAGLISAVLGTILPGHGTIYLGQDLKFKAPVYIGETVTARVEVVKLRTDKRIATLSTNCYNQDGKLVIDGEAVVLYPESPH
jgi:3-hydroxybutyryl-CoA dehydratase